MGYRHRRKGNLLALLIAQPWYVSVATAGAVYISLRWIAPIYLDRETMLAPLSGASVGLAPMLASVLLVPAPFAWWRGRKEKRLIAKLRSVEVLRGMSWQDLEMVVHAIYERMGYQSERRGGEGADGGVDVMLRRGGAITLVQCKQWRARQVSVNVVRELLGAVTAERATNGILVTCGTFTADAWDFARKHGIALVDGLRLLKLAQAVRGESDNATALHLSMTTPASEPIENLTSCPLCGSQMVKRKAARGRWSGREFLGCSQFPKCEGIRRL
jgi:restriction system protein